MGQYLIKRIALVIPILIGVSFISFFLINLNTSDPAEVALRVNEIVATDEAVASMREELGLDKPFFQRYITWLNKSIRFDFGNSFINKKPVGQEILNALPATLYLAMVALIITLSIGITAGVVCSIFEDSILDKSIRGIIFLGTSVPNFWMGLLLIWLFSVRLNLLPTSGMKGFESVILPAITLSFSHICIYTRLIRNSMVENKKENYVLYTRARGLRSIQVTKHIFKNSIQSSITALGMAIPKLIAGTVIVENIYAWPGIGRLCVSAIFNRDYPIIQAYILMMAVLFVMFNLLVDIFNAYIDPRIRRME